MTQRLLGAVIGGLDGAVGEEDEQVTPDFSLRASRRTQMRIPFPETRRFANIWKGF
jgi:hypothetical protein